MQSIVSLTIKLFAHKRTWNPVTLNVVSFFYALSRRSPHQLFSPITTACDKRKRIFQWNSCILINVSLSLEQLSEQKHTSLCRWRKTVNFTGNTKSVNCNGPEPDFRYWLVAGWLTFTAASHCKRTFRRRWTRSGDKPFWLHLQVPLLRLLHGGNGRITGTWMRRAMLREERHVKDEWVVSLWISDSELDFGLKTFNRLYLHQRQWSQNIRHKGFRGRRGTNSQRIWVRKWLTAAQCQVPNFVGSKTQQGPWLRPGDELSQRTPHPYMFWTTITSDSILTYYVST